MYGMAGKSGIGIWVVFKDSNGCFDGGLPRQFRTVFGVRNAFNGPTTASIDESIG